MAKANKILEWVIWGLALAIDIGGIITASIGDQLANYTVTYAGMITGITGAVVTVLASAKTIATLIKTRLGNR